MGESSWNVQFVKASLARQSAWDLGNQALYDLCRNQLTDLFREISGLEKRSLASKYLHCHFLRATYIYDERRNRDYCPTSVPPTTKGPRGPFQVIESGWSG